MQLEVPNPSMVFKIKKMVTDNLVCEVHPPLMQEVSE